MQCGKRCSSNNQELCMNISNAVFKYACKLFLFRSLVISYVFVKMCKNLGVRKSFSI
jgi:hypothetical protein